MISLPDSIKAFVDQQVSNGSYDNASEYIRRLLLADQARESDLHLEKLLLEGLESGPEIEINEKFWSDLKNETELLLATTASPR